MLDELDDAVDERYLVPALDRGLRILALFTPEKPRWTLTDIARALELSRSSIFRLVFTLEHGGFLVKSDERHYRIGAGVLTLGFSVVTQQDVAEICRPFLQDLQARTGASAHLGIREGTQVIYLVRVASQQAIISNIQVGSRVPAHLTTMGRLLLADLSPQALRGLYGNTDIPADGSRPGVTLDDLVAQVAADGARGHVASESAYDHGLVSVAAPVRDRDGRVIAAINVSAPNVFLSLGEAQRSAVAQVVASAAAISRAMGFTGTKGTAP